MPDYSKGKIYRLTCDDPDLIYYGSTVLTLPRRLAKHKCHKNCSSKKLFEVGGVEIELVLECSCETKRELEEVEQTFIDNDECINKQRAFRTELEHKEWFKINRKYGINETYTKYSQDYEKTDKRKEYKKEYNKKYRESKKIKDI
jgi:hypothetical protein